MATEAQAATGQSRTPMAGPFKVIWALLTNVKFALVLVGSATAASMIGVLLPQVPPDMRENPAARAAWMDIRREDYGPFTADLMDRFDLFDIFHSPWFVGPWMVIILAVTVCTVSRLRPTWRTVERPPLRVAEGLFETALHRGSFVHDDDADSVATLLRGKRYRVTSRGTDEAGSRFLFADRFPWAQYATFVSHLALLLLLVGGVLAAVSGFSRTLALAEGRAGAPVFEIPGSDQIFVTMLDAHEGIDAEGNIVDFHSDLDIQQGNKTVTCTVTVNGPCGAFGYRFHQAAFFDDLAHLKIHDVDGRVLFDDILDFNGETAPLPQVRVTDSEGRTMLDRVIPQMASIPESRLGPAVALASFGLSISSGQRAEFNLGWQFLEGAMALSVSGSGIEAPGLRPGKSATSSAGLAVNYMQTVLVPTIAVLDLPGAADGLTPLVQTLPDFRGDDYLFITGVGEEGLVIAQSQSATGDAGIEYSFGGRMDASGIDVRRDPRDTFIWTAVIAALAGLTVTFWIPSWRLWVKVTPNRTYVAGAAGHTASISREIEKLGAELRKGP